MRIRTTLLAACAAALIAPAASQAATLGMDGDTLVYKGEGSEGISLLLSSYEDWNTKTEYLRFSESGADRVLITADICENDPTGGVICQRDPNRPIKIEGSEAKDDISIYSSEAVPDAIRPRIEHAQCLHPDDIPRFGALGVTASIQPSMAVTDAPVAERLWADRLDGAYAYRSLHASGARVALGSDAPVEEMDPLQGLRDAVLREWRAHEALDLQAALEALTVTPAWLAGDEDRRGRLRPGMLADLVVLDRDPFDDLAGAVVTDTWLAGRTTVSPNSFVSGRSTVDG